jgi:hypothetical protein
MTRRIHMAVSVRGMLSWPTREAKRMLKSILKADGSPYRTVDELREALMDELSRGHEVLPLGNVCDGFDFKDGCPGHEVEARVVKVVSR